MQLLNRLLTAIQVLLLRILGLRFIQRELASLKEEIRELDRTTIAQREAITLLDNAIQRFSRDGIPPDVVRTSSICLLEINARLKALEQGKIFLPEPK